MKQLFPVEIRLTSQETLTIREALEPDAASMVSYVHQIAGESDFLSFGVGEFSNTIEEEAQLVAHYQKADNHLFILGLIDGEIVSMLNVHGSPKARLRHIGEFGISVQKADWGKGIGRHMIQAMLAWAYENPLLKKIHLVVLAHNTRAISLYQDLGFVVEGRRSRGAYINGQYWDDILMGLAID